MTYIKPPLEPEEVYWGSREDDWPPDALLIDHERGIRVYVTGDETYLYETNLDQDVDTAMAIPEHTRHMLIRALVRDGESLSEILEGERDG